MKLIVDSGSTKMHLCLLAPDGSFREFEAPGVNALTVAENTLSDLFRSLNLPSLQSVTFYGAGVATPEIADKVRRALPPAPQVEVCSDLLGAARALLGRQRGVACILGTGSNTGLYNGSEITRNIPPLGFILGDEGSGANLGLNLLRAIYRGTLGPDMRNLFESETGLTYADVLERVYRGPQPNRFLASLVPWIRSHASEFASLNRLVTDAFARFFSEMAGQYGETRIALTGGVAAAFEPELRRACPPGLEITEICARPMPGLIKYHSLEK